MLLAVNTRERIPFHWYLEGLSVVGAQGQEDATTTCNRTLLRWEEQWHHLLRVTLSSSHYEGTGRGEEGGRTSLTTWNHQHSQLKQECGHQAHAIFHTLTGLIWSVSALSMNTNSDLSLVCKNERKGRWPAGMHGVKEINASNKLLFAIHLYFNNKVYFFEWNMSS